MDFLRKQLAFLRVRRQTDISWRREFVFNPVEDEVRFIDGLALALRVFASFSVDQDRQLFERIVLWCLRRAVPWYFCDELEWDGLLGEGDADFSSVWRAATVALDGATD